MLARIISWPLVRISSPQCQQCYDRPHSRSSYEWRLKRASRLFITHTRVSRTYARGKDNERQETLSLRDAKHPAVANCRQNDLSFAISIRSVGHWYSRVPADPINPDGARSTSSTPDTILMNWMPSCKYANIIYKKNCKQFIYCCISADVKRHKAKSISTNIMH